MRDSACLIFRTCIVLGVLITMPVLAIPPINRVLNTWIRGEATAWDELLEVSDTAESHTSTQAFHSAERGSFRNQPVLDRMLAIRDQLEDLGVDYMVLDTHGEQAQRYRFHCRIQVPGSAVYSRTFEAEDADPSRAMGQVLADIRVWRSAARAATTTAGTSRRNKPAQECN